VTGSGEQRDERKRASEERKGRGDRQTPSTLQLRTPSIHLPAPRHSIPPLSLAFTALVLDTSYPSLTSLTVLKSLLTAPYSQKPPISGLLRVSQAPVSRVPSLGDTFLLPPCHSCSPPRHHQYSLNSLSYLYKSTSPLTIHDGNFWLGRWHDALVRPDPATQQPNHPC